MILNRRALIASTSALLAVRSLGASARQEGVTSGGLGLSLADVQSIYEEGPQGQSFRMFIDSQTQAEMHIDFGAEDIAQRIWVAGKMSEDDASDLMLWLLPDDIEMEHIFEMNTGAGSIATQKTSIFHSPYFSELIPTWSGVMASYVVQPDGSGGVEVDQMMLAIGHQ